MADAHTVAVTLSDGSEVDVWDRYTITLDMLRAGNAWTFSFWHTETLRTTWALMRAKVKCGDNLSVSVDGAAQVTGRIESIATHVDRKGGAVMIVSGRDLGGIAESWDADPTVRLRGLPLSDSLAALFAPLGIPVVVSADAAAVRAVQTGTTRNARGVSRSSTHRRSQPVDRSHPRAGEKVWRLADEMCRRLGFLLWVAPCADGGLAVVVDVPAYDVPESYSFSRRVVGGVATGNILTSVETLDTKAVPTEVNVYSGTTRGDLISNRQRSQTFNVALDDAVVNRGFVAEPMPAQVRHVQSGRARTLTASAAEGARLVAEAMAGFRRVDITVQGHGQTVAGTSKLYAINTMARVYDDMTTSAAGDPLDESMLVTRVVMSGSRQAGTETQLTLVPKGSVVVVPNDG
jgi:prophage tail gpP-like protein